ncbi:MAG: YciI family protein [Bacteroidia bacterium]
MKEYLLLFRGGGGGEMNQSPEQSQDHMQRWMEWMGDLGKQGKFIGAQPLNNSGKLITGNKKVVSDGPFMEGKEIVGGYLICKADTYDEAVEISKGCPILEFDDGTVEVREIRELKM